MKNTLENKAKFFALYWGQNVALSEHYKNHNCGCFMAVPQDAKDLEIYLELKPLSEISDEDAETIAELYYDFVSKNCVPSSKLGKWHISEFYNELYFFQVDELRSHGYALPWNGITVEQQIEYGWVKLKQ